MIYRTIKGVRVPALGFGTFGLTREAGRDAILDALATGYRHIDTAIRYDNEVEVGHAIAASGVPREEIFLTSKIWFTDLAYDAVLKRARESLERLKTGYIDLLLIHWPNRAIDLGQTLKAFVELKAEGLTRQIGVANFTTALMRACVEEHRVDLFTNQVEYHPYLDQTPVYRLCRRYGMLMTAYLPLARGRVANDPVLADIGRRHGKSAAQVALRWLLQQEDVAAIPRSAKPEHIRENFDIFDFSLDEEDMARIGALRADGRIVNVEWAPQWDASLFSAGEV